MGERVLQVLGPSTGGIRRHVVELTNRLRERGWQVEVAGPEGVVDAELLAHAVDVPTGFAPGQALAARRQLHAAVQGAALIHAHGLKAGWIASTVADHPPLVVTVHNLVLREVAGRGTPPLRWLEGKLPSRADRVIAVSDEIAARFGRPSNLTVIPPAGPAPVATQTRDAARAALGVSRDAPLAVTVARLHPQKDIPTLLRAISAIDGLHLAVVGIGPLAEELRALARSLDIGHRVHFTGHQDNPADLMAAADVVVVSSMWESGPLALVEAMLLARPVVSTPVGLATTLVVDGETGREVPIGEVHALSDALAWVLADAARAAAMGERGREAALAALGPDRLVGEVEAVYRAALRR